MIVFYYGVKSFQNCKLGGGFFRGGAALRKILIVGVLFFVVITGTRVAYMFTREPARNLIYKALSLLPNKDEFVFVVLGDNKNSISTFGKMMEKINKDSQVSFVINTGDMVFDGSPIKYDFLVHQLRKLKKPLLTVPGNHDVADHGVENYLKIFGPLYYSFHVGPAYFIMLDNSNEKDIDPYQMKWFKKELQRARSFKYKFVFFHVPIFDPRVKAQPGHSMKDVKNAKKLLSILKEYGVTMVFCGHIHGYFRGSWDGVPYVITGGAGAELVGLNPNHYFYHYIKVHVSNLGVKYDLVRIKSPDFNLMDRLGAFIWLYTYSFIVINYWVVLLIIGLFVLFSMLMYGEERKLFLKLLVIFKNSRILNAVMKVSRKIGKTFEK